MNDKNSEAIMENHDLEALLQVLKSLPTRNTGCSPCNGEANDRHLRDGDGASRPDRKREVTEAKEHAAVLGELLRDVFLDCILSAFEPNHRRRSTVDFSYADPLGTARPDHDEIILRLGRGELTKDVAAVLGLKPAALSARVREARLIALLRDPTPPVALFDTRQLKGAKKSRLTEGDIIRLQAVAKALWEPLVRAWGRTNSMSSGKRRGGI